ncbi:MAG: ribosome maturation factor RimP [Clostridia bacterium]|nr:ribosome maturation factor RimP [Clostridia bacterium]
MAGKITEILYPHLEKAASELGLMLWDVEFVKEGSWYLRLYIDKEGGVGIEDCENYSRYVDPLLDELDVIDKSYCLEVSSPGVERVLKNTEQIKLFLGEKATVKLYDAIDGKKTLVAVLKDVDENILYTEIEGAPLEINRKNIAKMNLYFEF